MVEGGREKIAFVCVLFQLINRKSSEAMAEKKVFKNISRMSEGK
jgi:hypothetical protein